MAGNYLGCEGALCPAARDAFHTLFADECVFRRTEFLLQAGEYPARRTVPSDRKQGLKAVLCQQAVAIGQHPQQAVPADKPLESASVFLFSQPLQQLPSSLGHAGPLFENLLVDQDEPPRQLV
jgi:hypothetical protein